MSLLTITNTLNCSLGQVLGTGLAHCKFDFENMSGGGVGILKKKTNLSEITDLASIIALQKSGKLHVLNGVFSVEPQASENQRENSESGIEFLGTPGLAKYRVSFTNGIMFHRSLASFQSNRQYDIIMWDAAGNVLCRKDVQGNLRGYTVGQIESELPTMASGATGAKQSITFQWIIRSEFDKGVSFIDSDKLADEGISFLELDGVNELEITLNAPAAGTTITGRIASAFDNTLVDTTLLPTDFSVNGAAPSAITINPDGTFSATVAAFVADDVLNVSLNGIVSNTDNVLYKSNTAKVVATA